MPTKEPSSCEYTGAPFSIWLDVVLFLRIHSETAHEGLGGSCYPNWTIGCGSG